MQNFDVLVVFPVVVTELGVNGSPDNGHQKRLSTPLPKEINQGLFISKDGPEKEFHIRFLYGSVTPSMEI